MSNIEPSFLDEGEDEPVVSEGETQAPEPAPEPEPQPEPEAPPEPAPMEVEAPEAIPQPEAERVPLAAVKAERDRRQALEQENARLRAALMPQAKPDPYEEPEAYDNYRAEQDAAGRLNLKLDMSEELTRQVLKDDALVDTARDWAMARFAQSPAFYQEVMSHRNPYGYVVEKYRREQALEALGDPSEVDAFRAWKAAQSETQPVAAQAVAPPKPSAPPRSLASAPSAGGIATQVEEDGDGYDAEFKRKR